MDRYDRARAEALADLKRGLEDRGRGTRPPVLEQEGQFVPSADSSAH